MVTITTIQAWSDTAQAVVDWTVENAEGTDEGGNIYSVIKLTYNDEIMRFSPNYTDDDLSSYIAKINAEH